MKSVQRVSSVDFDVVVIGGGPAGMMAAATAAADGARTLLLEKNTRLGKKLSITGGGRCNITNNKPNVREMLASYQAEGKFLFSTFTQHGVADSKAWFLERGIELKEENEGRLFPVSDSAETVCAVLEQELKRHSVTVSTKQSVLEVVLESDTGFFKIVTGGGVFRARACVLATGGYARPDTGSTGDGFSWLTQLGHTINTPSNVLVPVKLQTAWTKQCAGITLPEVAVSVWAGGRKYAVNTGRLLFTHVGVTGPLILNMSQQIGDLLRWEPVELRLNLFPKLDAAGLKALLQEQLQSNKKLQNALSELMPAQVVRGILGELKIDGDTPCHSVRKEERAQLLQYLQAVPLEVAGLLGADKAIVSSGGVALTEVDFKTMESRMVSHLYLVGDVLHINRPSGGYSLQLCWSTGYVAGKSAAQSVVGATVKSLAAE